MADQQQGPGAGAAPMLGRGEMITLAVSYFVGGISGAMVMTGAGTPGWIVLVSSVTAYSLSSMLTLTAVLSTGGSMAAAVLSATLVGARFGVMAAAVAPRLERSVPRRVLAAHCVVDPAVSIALREPDPLEGRRSFWRSVRMLTGGWIVGTIVGVLVGSHIGDPKRLGLDVVFPASLVALLGSPLRRRDAAVAAITAAAVFLVLVPNAPAGVPVLASLLGVLAGMRAGAGGSHGSGARRLRRGRARA